MREARGEARRPGGGEEEEEERRESASNQKRVPHHWGVVGIKTINLKIKTYIYIYKYVCL